MRFLSFAALLASLSFAAVSTSATTLYSNIGSGNQYNTGAITTIGPYSAFYVAFTPTVSGNVTDIYIPVAYVGGATNGRAVQR